MIILGYAGYNISLREQHILISRTCRLSTAIEKGIPYLEDLLLKNLNDLLKIMQWNAENGIKFYRISSGLAPHCTNHRLMLDKDKKDFSKLVYPLEKFKKYFKKIGDYAKKNGIRLTFHPDLFDVLNSPNENIVFNTIRDLHYHVKMLELMELDYNSIVILHGGGVYGEKQKSMDRWIYNFNRLPVYIKQRVVLENDETSFNIDDILYMANGVDEFELGKTKIKTKVPVVFDIFHYYCYNLTIARKNTDEIQKKMPEIFNLVKQTWPSRNMKMHISEQLKDAVMGAHADYVNEIPKELLNFAKNNDVYLMVEAKTKELALLKLRKKYPKICI